jgi:hypothetical protein
MDFWLYYRGKLNANGSKEHKHELRKIFHSQIKELWEHEPFKTFPVQKGESVTGELFRQTGDYEFVTLVIKNADLYAELDITILRAEPPGGIVQHGDIDNRLKTLFDALRYPQNIDEIPSAEKPTNDYYPLYCLLEDDSLIIRLNVLSGRLLDCKEEGIVLLLIHVSLKSKGRKTLWLQALGI